MNNSYNLAPLSCANFFLLNGRIVTVVGTHGREYAPVVLDHSTGEQFLVFNNGQLMKVGAS